MTTEDNMLLTVQITISADDCASVFGHQGFFGFGLWDFGGSHLNALYDLPFFVRFLLM